MIEKMSELSTFETGVEGEDNANYRHPVDTQGNITGPRREEVEEVEEEEDHLGEFGDLGGIWGILGIGGNLGNLGEF